MRIEISNKHLQFIHFISTHLGQNGKSCQLIDSKNINNSTTSREWIKLFSFKTRAIYITQKDYNSSPLNFYFLFIFLQMKATFRNISQQKLDEQIHYMIIIVIFRWIDINNG